MHPRTLGTILQHLHRIQLPAEVCRVRGTLAVIRTATLTAYYNAEELNQLVIEAPLWTAEMPAEQILW